MTNTEEISEVGDYWIFKSNKSKGEQNGIQI